MDVYTGTVLVSAPDLSGVFDRSLVLIVDAGEDGSTGLVLNKFSLYDIDSALPGWSAVASYPPRLFDGGPVARTGALCLAVPRDDDEDPPGWRRVAGRVGLLHLDAPLEIVRGAYRWLRVFSGYAGWAPGQLEAELDAGAWYVVDAALPDLFSSDPDAVWRRVLRHQGGDLALLASWTPHPELN